MRNDQPRFLELTVKTIVVHTVTYFCVGALAFWLLDYATLHSRPDMAGFIRQTTDPMVMAGPLFQPIRGLVFALVIYPLRQLFLARNGWLLLWWVLVALGIISTFGAAPGSLEGLVYARISVPHQLIGLPEVVLQALALAFGLVYWVNHPRNRWLTWVMGGAFVVVVALPIVGLLAGPRPNEERSAIVIRSYESGLSAIQSANPDVKLSIGRDPGLPDGPVLFVEYPSATDDPAGRDVWCEAENRDWTPGRAISFRIKPDQAMRLSVSFLDRNLVAYTTGKDLTAGEWQTVDIPFDDIRPNPYFQPPGAKTGAPIDVSEVTRIGFAPQSQAAGRFAIGPFIIID